MISELTDALVNKIAIVERSMDSIEQQIASLAMGYVDMAATIEAITKFIQDTASLEDIKAFSKLMREAKQKSYTTLKEASNVISGTPDE